MRAIRVLVVVAFHLCSLVSVVAGTPQSSVVARDARATTPSGSAIVRGRVVAAATGEPIGRAIVRVESPSLELARSMMTDLDGRFEFQHLPAAQITLSASKTGFLSLHYGQRRPFQAGRPIALTSGQVLDKMEIALPRAGVIAGRVFDDVGEPATGVAVEAARLKFESGQRTLSSVGSRGETDDRGEYRISELPPGSYFVLARREGVPINATSVDEGVGTDLDVLSVSVEHRGRAPRHAAREPGGPRHRHHATVRTRPQRVGHTARFAGTTGHRGPGLRPSGGLRLQGVGSLRTNSRQERG